MWVEVFFFWGNFRLICLSLILCVGLGNVSVAEGRDRGERGEQWTKVLLWEPQAFIYHNFLVSVWIFCFHNLFCLRFFIYHAFDLLWWFSFASLCSVYKIKQIWRPIERLWWFFSKDRSHSFDPDENLAVLYVFFDLVGFWGFFSRFLGSGLRDGRCVYRLEKLCPSNDSLWFVPCTIFQNKFHQWIDVILLFFSLSFDMARFMFMGMVRLHYIAR